MGAVMCISCEPPGGRTDILRSWWAKTGITLIVKWWWVCCASLDDSCRNDCVRCEFHVNYVSQFPWCIVSRRSTLRPKSFKSYFTSGWIKKTSNGQSGQTFQFTHWHLWIRFWCPVTHGLSNNISISRHLSTAQVVLKVCASRWDQKSALEFHGHHWVSTIYRSIATTCILLLHACMLRSKPGTPFERADEHLVARWLLGELVCESFQLQTLLQNFKKMGWKKNARLTNWGDHKWWMGESCWHVLDSVTLFLELRLFVAIHADLEGKQRIPVRFWTAGEWIIQEPSLKVIPLLGTLPEANTV